MTRLGLTPKIVANTCGSLDVVSAAHEINMAWEQYKKSTVKHFRDALEFGRVCHEWQLRYKSQGSRHGKGFERVLQQLGIPKSTAYRWIRRYEIRLRANRDEVATHKSTHSTEAGFIVGRIARSLRALFPNEAERNQFEEDVLVLGGTRRVIEMFLSFVSEKAVETRRRGAV